MNTIRYCERCDEWVKTIVKSAGHLYGISMGQLHICPKCEYATDLMKQPPLDKA